VVTTGEGYCWGWNESGELGVDSVTSAVVPTPVTGNLRFTSISVGGVHSCGITVGGTLYCWGSNEEGQLGVGDAADHSTPALVDAGLTFTSVSAGVAHTCGITLESELYCWGRNLSGELGDDTMNSSDRPHRIAGP
jgi:alpha-tubulin suppressor-like RCC1 family protein